MNTFVCACGRSGDFDRLVFVGVQRAPAGDDGAAFAMAMRNCRCGSTVTLVVDEAEARRLESCACGHLWTRHVRARGGALRCCHHGCGCRDAVLP